MRWVPFYIIGNGSGRGGGGGGTGGGGGAGGGGGRGRGDGGRKKVHCIHTSSESTMHTHIPTDTDMQTVTYVSSEREGPGGYAYVPEHTYITALPTLS